MSSTSTLFTAALAAEISRSILGDEIRSDLIARQRYRRTMFLPSLLSQSPLPTVFPMQQRHEQAQCHVEQQLSMSTTKPTGTVTAGTPLAAPSKDKNENGACEGHGAFLFQDLQRNAFLSERIQGKSRMEMYYRTDYNLVTSFMSNDKEEVDRKPGWKLRSIKARFRKHVLKTPVKHACISTKPLVWHDALSMKAHPFDNSHKLNAAVFSPSSTPRASSPMPSLSTYILLWPPSSVLMPLSSLPVAFFNTTFEHYGHYDGTTGGMSSFEVGLTEDPHEIHSS